jgi:hypothetical protein
VDDFAKEIREAAQITNTAALARMAELAATPNCDVEIAIKIFQATKDVAGAVPDKKADPFANLPVFHITFNNGRMLSNGVTPALTIDAISEAFSLELAVPSEAMVRAASINDELLLELDP